MTSPQMDDPLVNGKIALSIAPVPRQIDEAGRVLYVLRGEAHAS